MKNLYAEKPLPVKPNMGHLRHRYPLLLGFRTFLINSLPFVLIWIVSGINLLAAALTAFGMMLCYALRENYRNNKRLSEMARKVKEKGNA